MTIKADFQPIPKAPTIPDFHANLRERFYTAFHEWAKRPLSAQLAHTYLEHFRANGCPIRLKTQPEPSKRLGDYL